MLLTLITSPLEQFEVLPFLSINVPFINGLSLALTNYAFYTVLVMAIVAGLHLIYNNNFMLIPNKASVLLESIYSTIHSMVKVQIGSANEAYFPIIYALFIYLLIANLSGNVPYSYTIGTSIVFSVGLSLTIFIGVTLIGLIRYRLHFFSFFIPAGTPVLLLPLLCPIELISYLARAVSLGVRLFANLVAGHTLLKILSGFLITLLTSSILSFLITLLPLAIFTGLIGLEIGVSFIQAYVFCILTCSYLKDAIDLH